MVKVVGTRDFGEIHTLSCAVQVFEPGIGIAHFEQQTLAQSLVDALVDLGLTVLTDETLFSDEGVYELEFSQLVVAVDGVFGGGLDPHALQLLLQTLVLLLRQVLLELGRICSVAPLQQQLQFGRGGVVVVECPLAGV